MGESGKKPWLRGCLLIGFNSLVVLALLLAIAEAVLRFYYTTERFQLRPVTELLNMAILPEKLELLEPAPFVTDSRGFLVANPAMPGVNAEGYRTPGFDEARPGQKRILLLGDSFAWGLTAEPLTECFADKLRDAGYTVNNLGIPATGPAQYAAQAEEYIPRLKPDAVCVSFYPGNDFQVEPRPKPGETRAYLTAFGFLPAHEEHGAPLSFEEARANYEAMMGNGTAARLTRAIASTAVGITMTRLASQLAPQEERTSTALGYLRAVRELCAQHGAKFLLFTIPVRPMSRDEFTRPEAVLKNLAELAPLSPGDFAEERYAGNADEHFNNSGHAAMAAFMVEELTKAGFPPLPTAEAAPLVSSDPSLGAFLAALGLPPDNADMARGALNTLKDELCELLLQGRTDPAARAGAIAACRAALALALPESQRGTLDAMSDDTLASVFTGHVPYDGMPSKLAARLGAARLGVTRTAEGKILWGQFAEALGLNTDQDAEAKAVVDGYQAGMLALMQRPAKGGGPSPMDLMAAAIAAGKPGEVLNKELDAYLQGNADSVEGKPYHLLYRDLEAPYREELLGLLNAEQLNRFRQLGLGSLAQVETGTDVLGAAIQARARELMGSTATATWDLEALRAKLQLSDAQAEAARAAVLAVKSGQAEALARPAREGGKAPLDVMAEKILARVPEEELNQLVAAYTRGTVEAGSGKTYDDLVIALEQQQRAGLIAMLTEEQRAKLSSLGMFNLLRVTTPEDPLGEAVRRKVSELSGTAAAPVASAPSAGPDSWVKLKAMLNLRKEQVDAVKGIVNGVKDEMLALYQKPPKGDGPTPLAFLQAHLKETPGDATAKFAAYLKDTVEGATGESFAAQAEAIEAKGKEAISALLNDAQRLRLERIGLGPLSEIATGYDPVGEALKAGS